MPACAAAAAKGRGPVVSILAIHVNDGFVPMAISREVEVFKVETEDQARELRFVGSPTIRVDGQDIDPPIDSRYILTCRAYRLEDGRISPLPSKDMIRHALRSVSKGQPG